MSDERHFLLVAGGSYTDSSDQAETWQCGIRFLMNAGDPDLVGTLPSTQIDDANDASSDDGWDYTARWGATVAPTITFDVMSWMHDYAVPSWTTMVESDAFSSQVTLEFLKASPIKENGLVDGGRTATAANTNNTHGTSGGGLLPLQIASVVSWQTLRIGRHGRGRIYLPALAKDSYGDHGRLTTTARGVILDQAVALIEGLAFTAVGGGLALHIRPIVTGSPWTQYGIIQSVKVGDVPDTQRRRRRQLEEAYVTDSVSY